MNIVASLRIIVGKIFGISWEIPEVTSSFKKKIKFLFIYSFKESVHPVWGSNSDPKTESFMLFQLNQPGTLEVTSLNLFAHLCLSISLLLSLSLSFLDTINKRKMSTLAQGIPQCTPVAVSFIFKCKHITLIETHDTLSLV